MKDRLLKGWEAGGRTFKVHLDGYNLLPYLTGQEDKSARKEFFYFNDDGELVALRYENWKFIFCEQRVEGTLQVWTEPFAACACRAVQPAHGPLRAGPHHVEHLLRLVDPPRVPGGADAGRVAQFLATFKEFPPRQRPASFSVDQVMDMIGQPEGGPPAVGTRAIQ